MSPPEELSDDEVRRILDYIGYNKPKPKKKYVSLWDTSKQTWVMVDKSAIRSNSKTKEGLTKKVIIAGLLDSVLKDVDNKEISVDELNGLIEIIRRWCLKIEGREVDDEVKKLDRFGFMSFDKE